jgi:hypothetical protein
MIPDIVDNGSVWEVLPSGVHDATLDEIKKRFVTNARREELFEGLKRGCLALKAAGCGVIYLDGSFVTSKEVPNDFDVCWDPTGVDVSSLDPVFLDFNDHRKNQKIKFLGEFFPSSSKADHQSVFMDFFQIDKHTRLRKGIIKLLL